MKKQSETQTKIKSATRTSKKENSSKRSIALTVAATMALQLGAQGAFAQFGDEEDMSDSPSGGSSASSSSTGKILSEDQKNKIAQASTDEITEKNFPEQIDSFDFNNADITDVIKAIGELTGKNFIIDPAVRGKITVIAPTKISVAEAYKAFLSALAINGYTVVPSGSFLKVKSARNAQRDSIETYSGTYFPNSDQMITRIIHLKHISAEQVNRDLRILPSKDGEMSIYSPTNSIILSDYGSNIERVMKIISQLDVPGFEEKLVVIPIKYAKAKDIAELVNKIVNKDQNANKSGGTFTSGVPRFSSSRTSTQGSSGSAYFMVIPDDRTNALIVVGNTPGIQRIRKLIGQLDFKIRPEDSGGVSVYYVKYGEAEKIATTLSGIAKENKAASPLAGGALGGGSSSASSGGQEIFGGDVKIVADKDTNSLIVTASKQDYDVVLNLLSKIDIPRDQVYVETIILEMVLEDSFKYGVGYFQYDKASQGIGRAGFNGFSGTQLAGLLSPTGGEGAILGFGSKDKVTIKMGTTSQEVSSVMGFINFLKGVGQTNILSTPQILALDNEEAEINVSDEVATSLQTSTGSNGVTQTSATFKEAGLTLKIKPFISPASDTIRMKIEQKTGSPKEGTLKDTVTISKRSITTNIVVPDGDTAVLGGLVKDEERESVQKVPVLGDIPILGWLFKSKKVEKTKANLLVLMTPKIIRNSADRQGLLGKKLDQRLDYVKSTGGRDPFGKTIDTLPRRAALDDESPVKTDLTPMNQKPAVETAPPEEPEAGTVDEGDDTGASETETE